MNTHQQQLEELRKALRKRLARAREFRQEAEELERMDVWNAYDGRAGALCEVIRNIDDMLAGQKMEVAP